MVNLGLNGQLRPQPRRLRLLQTTAGTKVAVSPDHVIAVMPAQDPNGSPVLGVCAVVLAGMPGIVVQGQVETVAEQLEGDPS